MGEHLDRPATERTLESQRPARPSTAPPHVAASLRAFVRSASGRASRGPDSRRRVPRPIGGRLIVDGSISCASAAIRIESPARIGMWLRSERTSPVDRSPRSSHRSPRRTSMPGSSAGAMRTSSSTGSTRISPGPNDHSGARCAATRGRPCRAPHRSEEFMGCSHSEAIGRSRRLALRETRPDSPTG